MNGVRRYIKLTKECFIRFSNTSMWVGKKIEKRGVFSLFENQMKHVFDILHKKMVLSFRSVDKSERTKFCVCICD